MPTNMRRPSFNKVCVVAGGLIAPGGAERVACWLANSWSNQGLDVTMITLGTTGESFFGLESSVTLVPIGHAERESNLLRSALLWMRMAWRLRRALKAAMPDCIVSFVAINNIVSLLTSRGLGSRVIVSERSDPSMRRLPFWWEGLRRLTYPLADSVVVQTEHAMQFFPEKVRLRGRIIPNPVTPPHSVAATKEDRVKPRRTLIGLGSLRHVKGFDRLIEAFSSVAAKHPEWDLVIYGEGPSRPELEEQIRRAGHANRIGLPGVTRDPQLRLREADLFVLCSRSEGFPNALAEAMACGLPVISFDCKSGPRELIRNGIDGVLVPDGDVVGLAMQMDRLMGDPSERERVASRATEVVQRFSSEKVFGMWQQAAEQVPALHDNDAKTSGAHVASSP